MATCDLVVTAYTDLRDALSALALRTNDSNDRTILLQRAVVSGSLAEQCDTKYSGKDVPYGGTAVDQANHAAQEATEASGTNSAQTHQVIADADTANATLQGILGNAAFLSVKAPAGLIGALRVSPSPRAMARANGNFSLALAEAPKVASPAYVTNVAKLFPIEAATLFPLGQSLVGDRPVGLLIIIVTTALFTMALRYFATQVDGKPAWNEIGASLVSLLLWIGATQGYWIATHGWNNHGLTADLGSKLYGFITVMWVALVPYLVLEQAKRDAGS